MAGIEDRVKEFILDCRPLIKARFEEEAGSDEELDSDICGNDP